jgi:hypothetical protein
MDILLQARIQLGKVSFVWHSLRVFLPIWDMSMDDCALLEHAFTNPNVLRKLIFWHCITWYWRISPSTLNHAICSLRNRRRWQHCSDEVQSNSRSDRFSTRFHCGSSLVRISILKNANPRDKQFLNSRCLRHSHSAIASIPIVKITDDWYAHSISDRNGKYYPRNTIYSKDTCIMTIANLSMFSLTK